MFFVHDGCIFTCSKLSTFTVEFTPSSNLGACLCEGYGIPEGYDIDFHKNLRVYVWSKEMDQAFEELHKVLRFWLDSDTTLLPYNIQGNYQAAWGSVTFSAHIYNALRAEKVLHSLWTDMELGMGWHPELSAPRQLNDYHNQYNPIMGLSATTAARNRQRAASLPGAKNGPKRMKMMENVSHMFVARSCEGLGQTGFTEADLNTLLADGAGENDEEDEGEEVIFFRLSRTLTEFGNTSTWHWAKCHHLPSYAFLRQCFSS
ncbi:hypothetical protein BDV12DRAFT_202875 [Aspergillus spectabilis]